MSKILKQTKEKSNSTFYYLPKIYINFIEYTQLINTKLMNKEMKVFFIRFNFFSTFLLIFLMTQGIQYDINNTEFTKILTLLFTKK